MILHNCLSAHNYHDQSYLQQYHTPQFKYMKFRIFTLFFSFYGYITNAQNGQLSDGLIAQLVEVMDSNPVHA